MRYTIVQNFLLLLLFWSWLSSDRLLLFERSRGTAVVAAALMVASFALGLLAFVSLRSEFRVGPEPRHDGRLVTSGVYRHFRHPMYTSMIALAVGLFLSKPTANMALAAATLVAFYLIKAKHEEKLLSQRYPGYEQHRARSFGVVPLRRGG
jgi:protein-S-isoprenylcysteine O-methyltransferase Ste14